MSQFWNHLFDLLKITLPLLVFYFLFKRMIDTHFKTLLSVANSGISKERSEAQFKLRLQALERMSLYIERIDFRSLMYRLGEAGITVDQLYHAMKIAMQEELEHNITQKLYLSDNLWQIIGEARNHQSRILDDLSQGLDKSAPSDEFVRRIMYYLDKQEDHVLSMARKAIKEEAKLLI